MNQDGGFQIQSWDACHWSYDQINEVRWLLDLTHEPRWRLSKSVLGYHLSYDQINEVRWLLDLTQGPRWRLSKSVLRCHLSYGQILNQDGYLTRLMNQDGGYQIQSWAVTCLMSYDQINEA
jgi:hypothetical protein